MPNKSISDPHPYEQHVLTLALIIITALLVYSQLAKRLDLLAYDAFVNATPVAADANTVIISIDEKSLNSIGQWPWRRAIHAQLVDKLNDYKASLIVFDVIFSEYDTMHPGDDDLFAQTLRDAGNVLLPLHIHPISYDSPLSEILPIPELAEAAKALGHVHVELDEDGLTRGLYLTSGVGEDYWPSLSLAMAIETNPMIQYLNEIKQHSGAPYISVNSEYRMIPFAGPRGTYPTYSFIDVMANNIAPEAFRDKVVLIGATAAGLGDIVPTPLSHMNSPMSGVEIHANAYAAIMSQQVIKSVNEQWAYLLTFAFILIPILVFPRLQATHVMPSTLVLVALVIAFSYLLIKYDHTWFPPINSVIGILLAYPLWSWQRMRHLNSFFKNELERLNKEPDLSFRNLRQHNIEKIFLALISILKPSAYAYIQNDHVLHGFEQDKLDQIKINEFGIWFHDDQCSWIKLQVGNSQIKIGLALPEPTKIKQVKEFLDKLDLDTTTDRIPKRPSEQVAMRIAQVRDAITAMQDMRTFISRGFEEMPGAVIVTDPIGMVVYANSRALAWLHTNDEEILSVPVYKLFAPHVDDQEPLVAAVTKGLVEGRGEQFNMKLGQRDVMTHCLPFLVDENSDAGLMISMSDISQIKQQQREKNQLIDFLSHDVRSPLSSQLAILQGLRSGRVTWEEDLIDELASHAERSLSLSEQFLQITRAEQVVEDDFYEFELVSTIENAIDSVNQQGQQKKIKIILSGEDELWAHGNAELVERAIVNLLTNAIKYSDPNKLIEVDIKHTGQIAILSIKDQGFGIKEAELPHIFDRFRRQKHSEMSGPKGAGLGLNFVQVVIEKHHGDISVESTFGAGTQFCIRLPVPTRANAPILNI
jgi:CHASE2 domain-containing sensor protein/signal transduction histidine kinase